MHYLVDAYNLLFRLGKTPLRLHNQRQQLIEQLNELANTLHLTLTLVFDGADPHIPYALRGHYDALSLVYTPEQQTADDYILQEIAESSHPSQITVVTNDRALSKRCHHLKAHTLSSQEFFLLLLKKEKKKQNRSSPSPHQDTRYELTRLLILFEKRAQEPEDPPDLLL